MGLQDTEWNSLLYYLEVVQKKSPDEAVVVLSRLKKYPDIFKEFKEVAFAYWRKEPVSRIVVQGMTAGQIRKIRNCSVLESYLQLITLRETMGK